MITMKTPHVLYMLPLALRQAIYSSAAQCLATLPSSGCAEELLR